MSANNSKLKTWLQKAKEKEAKRNGEKPNMNASTRHIVRLNRELALLKQCFKSQGQLNTYTRMVKDLDDSEMDILRLEGVNLQLIKESKALAKKLEEKIEENSELWNKVMRTQIRR